MNKEIEERMTDALDNAYDQALGHAIEIVRLFWSFAPLQDPKNNPFQNIITELYKLKSDGNGKVV